MEFRHIFSTLILIALTSFVIKLFLLRRIRFSKFIRWFRLFSDKFHDHQLLHIPEFNDNFQTNDLFRRVHLYLNSLESLEDSDFTNLFSGSNPNDVVLTLNLDQAVVDTFLGAYFCWKCRVAEIGDARLFSLKVRKRDKKRVLRTYLQHILEVSDDIDRKNREIRLFTGGGRGERWRSVKFTHPATMDTIAIDAEVKNRVDRDIDTFLKSRDYYHRIGRVWRRSYLLYGPPGTGKSSFAAALAKKLSYDVYDFDLSRITDDVELKFGLLQTTPKSVILIEDFDKFVVGKTSPGNFSGVMNFMDGVVNSCCDERVLVFTMKSKDEIDPAVLRPGRVDVHIHFPMCDFNNFKILATNYLGIKEHKLFARVEEMFSSGVSLSPAEIGEIMMVNRTSPNRAIKSVISALQTSSAGLVGGGVENGKEAPKNEYKPGRVSVDRSRDSVDGGIGVGFKDGAKEIRKLYSLLRRKSGVSKSGSFDLGT